MTEAGRHCPLHYRYSPRELARPAEIQTETLYIVGGLYGNRPALEQILTLIAADTGTVTLVFNGDFNWFNVDTASFQEINKAVLGYIALRGNVETELADDTNTAGCGCAYPDWVDDGVVVRSNQIMEQLQKTARRFPEFCRMLRMLPMHRVAEVGGVRIGIVHGDSESLAGWGFSQESLSNPRCLPWLQDAFREAQVRIFASTHTCLPVLQTLMYPTGEWVIVNNGAAGMPNFRATRYGLMTRISVQPANQISSLYGIRIKDVYVDAIPVYYDHAVWLEEFLDNWPSGSPGYESYFDRLIHGPDYGIEQARRNNIKPPAVSSLWRPNG